jgi:hypothetical protein
VTAKLGFILKLIDAKKNGGKMGPWDLVIVLQG